jgi:hypothetical protein
VATAALLVAALGLVGCASSSDHESAPSTSRPTTAATTPATTPASTTTSPLAGLPRTAPGPYDWTRAASPALAVGGGASSTLAAVLPPASLNPWIVAGTRLGADDSSTATVWTSPDGASWQATALTGLQVDSQAGAAASWRRGTVIVGSVGRGTESHASVWIAASPVAPYTQVATGTPSAGGSAMTSVAGGALGLFAAGTENGHVALWYSSNGGRWTELTAAERVIGDANDPHIETLLAGLEGNVYAAGWERSGSSIVAAMWSSSDGINWHPVQSAQTAFAGPGDHLITGLASLGTGPGSGLVAVGGSRTGTSWSPASWISPNGASWSEPSVSFVRGARSQMEGAEGVVRGLSAVETGVHTAALTAVGGGPTAQRLWTSTDGLHWAEVALPATAANAADWHASLVAVSGGTSLVADADPGQPYLLVRHPSGWLEPSRDPAVFGPVQAVARPTGLASSSTGLLLAVEVERAPQAIGPTSSSVEFLSSVDGTTWLPLPTGRAFDGSRVTGLGAVPAGFVAVGWTQVGARRQAAIWASPDGRSWGHSLPLDLRPITSSDQATGVCFNGSLVMVVGSVSQATGTAARAWVSRDVRQWTLAAIVPQAAPGVSSAMAGCAATPTGGSGPDRVNAFGVMSVRGSGAGPAYWSADHATVWTRATSSPFGPGLPFPARDVARSGTLLLSAASGPDTDGLPPGLGVSAEGTSALWRSADSGGSWQRLDTPGPPWSGAAPAQFDRVAWSGPTPVVAGAVDGRLAVWTGIFNG